MSAETTLYRNPRDMVHRRDCRYRTSKSLAWNWAEGRNRADLVDAVMNGLKFCKVCDALHALPDSPDGEHELTTDEALDFIANGATSRDVLRLRWPSMTDDACDYVLWEFTPFPMIGGVHDLADYVAVMDDPAIEARS